MTLRARLTLVFALAMAAVLVAVGAFVYVRLQSSLDEQLDESLQARLAALQAGSGLEGGDDDLAQVVGADGTVRAGSQGFEGRAVATSPGVAADLMLAGDRFRVASAAGEDGTVVVAGASLEDRDEALAALRTQLLVGGPIALLLASLAGWLLAGAALRPVEAMRCRAAEISSDTAGARLPEPRGDDEVARLARTLNEMLGRLEAGLERERRFVADASHELRTPLALLQAELELALRRERSREELEAALASAADETDRLVRLANDLLVLARADEGQLRLDTERVLVRPLLETVSARFASRAAAGARTLEIAAAPDLVVAGDRLRLEQALGNLVDNALRHGAGTVRIEAERRNGSLALRVSDDGPGFSTAFAPHAFERFSRGDGARAGSGAGLGLALVDAIARAHGGSVALEVPGAATVAVVLPA